MRTTSSTPTNHLPISSTDVNRRLQLLAGARLVGGGSVLPNGAGLAHRVPTAILRSLAEGGICSDSPSFPPFRRLRITAMTLSPTTLPIPSSPSVQPLNPLDDPPTKSEWKYCLGAVAIL